MIDQKERNTGDIIRETGKMSCPVQKAAYYMNTFLRDLMCGKCFPCAFGTHEASIILRAIISGNAAHADIDALRRIADMMLIGSRCRKGRDTAQFMTEMLKAETFAAHVGGRCTDRECTLYSEYRIIPDKCVICGECQAVCRYHAVIGEKKVPYLSGYLPFQIVAKRCTRCGECLKVCPNDAIIVEDKKDTMATVLTGGNHV
jgi:formate hydrogenlyase subunit 6/NADH:ubiquinone oxidoreductase subunit I